ncbi:recombination protein O N-terminal domain-containing protein [Novosphingobium profundi]|uniref:DNA repair protein RecO n=1 Tax=Novosphingobium profundi TaxID=1774954 RepID=UPI001BD98735|nr:recombination protein O N-terminal domain-containing protein [Novosphingobium profundi]MBT0668611.1 recombination protein O N-terminal domain-containing protein [Novosphingobium profundi]
MELRTEAIVCAIRAHGETAAIVRFLTHEAGIVAAYVAGARGRTLRPVLIPGNIVAIDARARSEGQLPFAKVELVRSRGPWLGEPLPAAALVWLTTLTAAALPERQPYPALHEALEGLLDAVCLAPSARGWVLPLLSYEVLLLRELGYGVPVPRPTDTNWPAILGAFDRIGRELALYPLAERRKDAMAARTQLRERLGRISD